MFNKLINESSTEEIQNRMKQLVGINEACSVAHSSTEKKDKDKKKKKKVNEENKSEVLKDGKGQKIQNIKGKEGETKKDCKVCGGKKPCKCDITKVTIK